LKKHDMQYELVPGVSSALAAPALAGFPLTDKMFGTSAAVFSAHAPESIPWAPLREAVDTVVLLMSGRTFQTVLAAAVEAGWCEDTPVCFTPAHACIIRGFTCAGLVYEL
jgi:siroheme synthase